MEVILQENYPSLGYVGDRVRVRPGFARNFLIPRGIALEASVRNERMLQHRLSAVNAKKAKLRGEAEEYAKKLADVNLEFTIKHGEAGKAFGAITPKDLEAALQKLDFQVSRKQIRIAEPLKKVGEYKVAIKLHAEVSASVSVKLISEKKDSKPEDSEESGARKMRTRRPRKTEAAGQEGSAEEKAARGEKKGKKEKKEAAPPEGEKQEEASAESKAAKKGAKKADKQDTENQGAE
jgi:large subunit ribosomal protein L9